MKTSINLNSLELSAALNMCCLYSDESIEVMEKHLQVSGCDLWDHATSSLHVVLVKSRRTEWKHMQMTIVIY